MSSPVREAWPELSLLLKLGKCIFFVVAAVLIEEDLSLSAAVRYNTRRTDIYGIPIAKRIKKLNLVKPSCKHRGNGESVLWSL